MIWHTMANRRSARSALRLYLAPMAAIVAVAAVLSLPCILTGLFRGHDTPTHVMYLHHFSSQFWKGELYPRWLAEANKGYGCPIFLLQYPLPYFVMSLLQPILHLPADVFRESRELGIYCFLVLAGSGITAWIWLRRRYGPMVSTIAAIVYMSLPYVLGQDLYTRSAIGELTAFLWMPLILSQCDRMLSKRTEAVCIAGVAYGLLVMSNALSAILMIPVVILYVAKLGRRLLVPAVIALALGCCLAAVYLIPLAAYEHLFRLDLLHTYTVYFELGRSFPRISLEDLRGSRGAIPELIATACLIALAGFYVLRSVRRLWVRLALLGILCLGAAVLVPGVGASLILSSHLKVSGLEMPERQLPMKVLLTVLLTAVLGVVSYCRIAEKPDDSGHERLFLAVLCGSLFLMLPWSAFVWKIVPQLSVIQFPWRLCGILTLATTVLFAAAISGGLEGGSSVRRAPSRMAIVLLAVTVVGVGNFVWRIDSRFRRGATATAYSDQELDMMFPAYVAPGSLDRFAESVGTKSGRFGSSYTRVDEAIQASVVEGRGRAVVRAIGPRRLQVSVACEDSCRVRVGQLYFPLWEITPAVSPLGSSAEGLLEVSLASGQHEFDLVFSRGWPENVGAVVTIVAVMATAGAMVFARREARENPRSERVTVLRA